MSRERAKKKKKTLNKRTNMYRYLRSTNTTVIENNPIIMKSGRTTEYEYYCHRKQPRRRRRRLKLSRPLFVRLLDVFDDDD